VNDGEDGLIALACALSAGDDAWGEKPDFDRFWVDSADFTTFDPLSRELFTGPV
jgi:hypothetical protein